MKSKIAQLNKRGNIMLDLFKTISFVFVIIATINLGLVGLVGLDLVGKVLGSMDMVLKIFHILVGLSGVMMLVTHLKK